MTRSWCPALVAEGDAVTFDSVHLGQSSGRSPVRSPEAQAKLIGAQAAEIAAASAMRVREKESRTAASPSVKFSARVAVSNDIAAASLQSTAEQWSAPIPPLIASLPDERAAIAPLQPKLLVRSIALLRSVTSSEAQTQAVRGYDLSRVCATTDELKASIGSLRSSSLESLRIRDTIRGTLGAVEVFKQLDDGAALRSLDIGSNPTVFSVADEPNTVAAEEAVKFLASSKQLHHLCLSGTGLGASSATVLPALKAHSTLTQLDLSRNGLGLQQDEAATAALLQLVQENKFLLDLDLSHNEIGAPLSKQLLEALQTSDTRVKTPEVEPEPEAEEYTDEAPPEEEPPQVTVGFPEDAVPVAAAPDGEEAPLQGGDGGDAPADQPASPPPPADVDTTNEPQDADDDEGAATPENLNATSPEVPEEEVDPEEAEQARLEEEQRRLEELRQQEEEWRAKMRQYIWEPEQVLFQFKESTERRAIVVDHVQSTLALKKTEKDGRKDAKSLQAQREREERNRRSGWSHLQQLDLSGNPIGNVGAKALAAAIRHEIPLNGDELLAKEEEAAKVLAELRAVALEERKRQRRELKALEQQQLLQQQQVQSPPQEVADEAPQEETPAADGEEQLNPEDVTVEDDAIPTSASPAGDGEGADGEGAGDAGALDAGAEEETVDNIDVSDIVGPPVKGTKPGLRTITSLKLDSCSIGSSGLKALSETLGGNCGSLLSLSVRKNKFGIRKKSVPVVSALGPDDDAEKGGEDEEGDGNGDVPTMKVDVPAWVSPGVVALSNALALTPSLTSLDLGWNRLYPSNIRLLAHGIRSCSSLQWLGLDGNHIGFDDGGYPGALSVLLEAVATQGSISTLLLNSCSLGGFLYETELTLLTTTPQLKVLALGDNNIQSASLNLWGRLLQDLAEDVPRCDGLTTLLLDRNVTLMGAEGGAAISSVVKKLPKLESLSLSGCSNLGDFGAARVLSVLAGSPNLKHVSLRRCNIAQGIADFATATAGLSGLEHVDVADNEGSFADYRALVHTLMSTHAKQPRLKFLSLWSRSQDVEDLIPDLISLVEQVPTVTLVDIGIPLVFRGEATSTSAVTESAEEDVFEALEKACLQNRLRQLSSQ